MRGRRKLGWLCGLALVALCGAAWAGEAPPTKEAAPPAAPVLSPEEQAAKDLIDRYKVEKQVQEDQKRFLAAQRVAAGQANIVNGAYEDARRQFEEALKLDPANLEAQEGLRKARSLLGVVEGDFLGLAKQYAQQRSVALAAQKLELQNMFNAANAQLEKGQFIDAIEGFTRVAARGRYLSPNIDVGDIVVEAEARVQKAMMAMEKKRVEDEANRRKIAEDQARELVEMRERLMAERAQALFRQATVLFTERRYKEVEKLCDEILRKDPSNGPAASLAEAAKSAGHKDDIERAIKERRAATDQHWQETQAYCVPYTQVRPYMPRDKFEEVRARKAATHLGEEIEEQEWERKIKESLNKKVTFDFVETPLPDVVNFLSSLVDVTIVLDTPAVKDAPNVTLRVNEMRLQSALNWILKLVALKYTLKDEAIFISKAEAIVEKPVLRMYDVTDLTIDIKNFQGRQQALASDSGYASTGSSFGGGGGDMAQEFFGDEDEEDEGEEKLTGESLVDFIKKTIAPGTWDEGGVVAKEF
ncbi:MAG: hypothetical protein FJ290_08270 [Planctomycetes bacterium]|nr:hypothetical protein [Planctomycetota bacterium]